MHEGQRALSIVHVLMGFPPSWMSRGVLGAWMPVPEEVLHRYVDRGPRGLQRFSCAGIQVGMNWDAERTSRGMGSGSRPQRLRSVVR